MSSLKIDNDSNYESGDSILLVSLPSRAFFKRIAFELNLQESVDSSLISTDFSNFLDIIFGVNDNGHEYFLDEWLLFKTYLTREPHITNSGRIINIYLKDVRDINNSLFQGDLITHRMWQEYYFESYEQVGENMHYYIKSLRIGIVDTKPHIENYETVKESFDLL